MENLIKIITKVIWRSTLEPLSVVTGVGKGSEGLEKYQKKVFLALVLFLTL